MKPILNLAAFALLALSACAEQNVKQSAADTGTAADAAVSGELSQEDRIAFFVHSARTGDLDGVRQGLAEGIPVDGRDTLDQTALLAAVSRNSLDGVQLLLERGANPSLGDKAGWTPLHFATYFGVSTEIVTALLAKGADINARNDRGITALYFASATGHELQVKVLLEHGADRELASQSGYTPLKIARVRGLEAVVALLDPAAAKAPARAPVKAGKAR